MRAFVLAFVAAFAAIPLAAQAAPESHVWVRNLTGKSVWVTAFTSRCEAGNPDSGVKDSSCTERHIVHEWCVPPSNGVHGVSKQGFHVPLTVVHVLVTEHPNCGRPIIKEWTFQFPRNTGSQAITRQYNVTRRALNGVQLYDAQELPK